MKYSMRNHSGLTLIEVLIALAILAIALTAIIKSSSQNIKDNVYLENKIIANWVGNDLINQVRAGLVKIPAAPSQYKQDVTVLGRSWTVQADITATPNSKIQEILVDVYPQGSDHRVTHLAGYLYAM